MLGKLNFVLLHVQDVAATRAFYSEKLGMEVEDENSMFVQFGATDGAMFALQKDPEAVPAPTVELWWQVADADALHTALVEKQVEIISAPKDEPFGRAFSLKDPAGNIVNLYQPQTV